SGNQVYSVLGFLTSECCHEVDHQGPLNRFTQKRNATKLIESNKKQVSDSSHSLTLQVASLHDHIQAQSIKAKLNSKGSEPC
ncbi:MAG: hypothetical protein DI619_04465, partial [Francisella sp.]